MTIGFTALFTKLGYNGGLLNSINTYRGTTVPAGTNDMYAEYTSTSDEATVDGFMATQSAWQNSSSSFLAGLNTLASQTVISTVNADVLQPDLSISTALLELINQMIANSQTVKQSVVGASIAAGGSNEGNPAFVLSVKTSDGHFLENLFSELLTGTCTADAQTGGMTAGQEQLSFLGQYAQPDVLNWKYPEGSGSSLSFGLINAAQTPSNGFSQWLTNGDFETWTVANVPDGWHIITGTAGTQVIETNVAYTGSHSLGLVGDSSTLTTLRQQFNVDNVAFPSPFTQYAVNFWIKANTVPAAGILQVALVDGTGTVINDGQGNANSFTVDLTTITTSFVAHGGSFRLPRLMPTACYLQLKLTTAVSTGSTIYVDRMAFTQMNQFYQGGPYIAGFSGNTNVINGDSWTVTTTNTQGGFQRLFDRYFGMKSLGLLLPSTTGTPTLPDSLITT